MFSEVRQSNGLAVRLAGGERAKWRHIGAGIVLLRYSIGRLMRELCHRGFLLKTTTARDGRKKTGSNHNLCKKIQPWEASSQSDRTATSLGVWLKSGGWKVKKKTEERLVKQPWRLTVRAQLEGDGSSGRKRGGVKRQWTNGYMREWEENMEQNG